MKKILFFGALVVLLFKMNLIPQSWFNYGAPFDVIRDELERKKYDINKFNEDGMTGLMAAAQQGNLDLVKLLLEYGADVNFKTLIPDDKGLIEQTALQIACVFGDNDDAEEIIHLLVEHKADVRAKNRNQFQPEPTMQYVPGGDTAVHQLMWTQDKQKRLRLTRYLVSRGADLNAQNATGNTMLHLAAFMNDTPWAEMLTATFGAKLNFTLKNKFGLTPYELASFYGNGDMAVRLLQLQTQKDADLEGDTGIEHKAYGNVVVEKAS